MTKNITKVEDSKLKDPLTAKDIKSKSGKKFKKLKRRQKIENILITELLGDFSVQTGSYF